MKTKSIKQIADDLNLSVTTVSFIINGKGKEFKISEQTQKRVLAYIKEINYHPNAVARSLSIGRSQTIAYIVPDISNPFFGRIGRIIEDELAKYGYQLMIGSADENEEREKHLVENMLFRQMDGFIIAPANPNAEHLSMIKKFKRNLVIFDRAPATINSDYVGIDNYRSIFSALHTLKESGHKNAALIVMTPNITTIVQRVRAFTDVFVNNDGDLKGIIKVADIHDKEKTMYRVLRDLFIEMPDVSVIFFVNNVIALTGLSVLNQYFKGKLPNLKLVAFDDIEYHSLVSPPVSGIEQPINEIAHKCVELLLQQIKSKQDSKNSIILDTKLVWR